MGVDATPQRGVSLLFAGYPITADDDEKTPPRRTPGQAEGTDEESERRRPEPDALRRKRPSQAEGEDTEDEADEVPPED